MFERLTRRETQALTVELVHGCNAALDAARRHDGSLLRIVLEETGNEIADLVNGPLHDEAIVRFSW